MNISGMFGKLLGRKSRQQRLKTSVASRWGLVRGLRLEPLEQRRLLSVNIPVPDGNFASDSAAFCFSTGGGNSNGATYTSPLTGTLSGWQFSAAPSTANGGQYAAGGWIPISAVDSVTSGSGASPLNSNINVQSIGNQPGSTYHAFLYYPGEQYANGSVVTGPQPGASLTMTTTGISADAVTGATYTATIQYGNVSSTTTNVSPNVALNILANGAVIGTGTLSGLADNSPWTTVTATWLATAPYSGQAIQLQVLATNFLEGPSQWEVPTFAVTDATLTATMPGTPTAPSGLSATPVSSNQVNLSWTDTAYDETGFQIDRSTNSSFTQNLTSFTTTGSTTSYSDTSVSPNTTYYYRVWASNGGTLSTTPSNTASATTSVASVSIPNYSFATPAQANGGYSNNSITNWTIGTTPTTYTAGVQNNTGANYFSSLPVGAQFAWVNADSNNGYDYSSDTLTSAVLGTVAGGDSYTLTVAVGNRGDTPYADNGTYTISLLDGGTVLASQTYAGSSITPGTWHDLSLVYTAPGSVATGNLQVQLGFATAGYTSGQVFGQGDFANVRLTAAANLASPTLTTTASPASVTLGSTAPTISDSAVLAGGTSETGSISFTLTLGSTTVYTTSDPVSGNGTYTASYTLPTTGTVTGTYAWTDSYSGDGNNNGANGNTGSSEQTVVSAASPTLSTAPSATGITLSNATPPALKDTATLAGGYYETGAITFTLYYGGSVVDTETAAVSGNGSYTTPAGYTLPTTGTVTGTYQWDASYAADGNNGAVSDNNNVNEQVTVGKASPTLVTTASLLGAPVAVPVPDGNFASDSANYYINSNSGGGLTFTSPMNATLSGWSISANPSTANGGYYSAWEPYGAVDSVTSGSGASPLGDNAPWLGNQPSSSYQAFMYYPGEQYNDGSVVGGPQPGAGLTMTTTGISAAAVTGATYTATIEYANVSWGLPTGATLNPSANVALKILANGAVVGTGTLSGLAQGSAWTPVTATWTATAPYSGQAIQIQVVATNFLEGPGSYDQWQVPTFGFANATLTEITASRGSATLGATAPTVSDSAVLTGGYNETGTVNFTLKQGSTTVYTTSDPVSGNGTYTANYTLPTTGTVTGTYAWTDSYSGDTNNNGATGNTDSSEQMVVGAASPTLSTTPSATSITLGNGTLPVLKDTATLAGGYYETGTITFTLYDGGSVVDTETAAVSGNGSYSTPTGYTLPTTGTVAGTYQWDASYGPDGNNNAASGSATVTVSQVGSTTTVLASNTTYDAAPQGATASWASSGSDGVGGSLTVSYTGIDGTTYGPSTTPPTNAGEYAASASFAGDTDHTGSSETTDYSIGQATASINVGYSGVYDSYAHGLSGTATGVGGITLPAGDLTIIATTYTNVADSGTVPEAWTFSNPNYQSASGSATVSITPATAVVTVTGYSVTYDGNQHEAMVVATGVGTDADLSGSVDLSGTAHTDAGNYATDPWSFSNPNYVSQSGTVSDSIGQATATISVGYSGVYDSYAHGLSGTATGVGGITLSAGDLTIIATTYTNVADSGTVPEAWTFSDPNYQSASGSATVSITPATAVVTVTGYSVTYDAQQYEATVVATGVGTDTDLSGSVDLSGTAHSDAGAYASRPLVLHQPELRQPERHGQRLHRPGHGHDQRGLQRRLRLLCPRAERDGDGRGRDDLPAGDLDIIGTTYTNVADSGTVPEAWTFSDPNYQSASGSATVSITPATAVVTVTGYSVTYDGNQHEATVVATGVGTDMDLSGSVDLSGTAHSDAGTYASDPWSFSNPNYVSQSGTVSDSIGQATATISVGYSGVYDSYAHGLSGTATGVGGVDSACRRPDDHRDDVHERGGQRHGARRLDLQRPQLPVGQRQRHGLDHAGHGGRDGDALQRDV